MSLNIDNIVNDSNTSGQMTSKDSICLSSIQESPSTIPNHFSNEKNDSSTVSFENLPEGVDLVDVHLSDVNKEIKTINDTLKKVKFKKKVTFTDYDASTFGVD